MEEYGERSPARNFQDERRNLETPRLVAPARYYRGLPGSIIALITAVR
jgi:hypothetical protein